MKPVTRQEAHRALSGRAAMAEHDARVYDRRYADELKSTDPHPRVVRIVSEARRSAEVLRWAADQFKPNNKDHQ